MSQSHRRGCHLAVSAALFLTALSFGTAWAQAPLVPPPQEWALKFMATHTAAAPGVSDPDNCAATGVSVTWGAASCAASYDLLVDGATTVTGVTSPQTVIPGDSSSHSYQIRSVNGWGPSAWSTATNGTDQVLAPPSVGTLTMGTSGSDLIITWVPLGNPSLVDYYEVMRSLGPQGPFDTSVGTAGGILHGFYLDLAAEPPTAYYKVRAVKGACRGSLD